MKLWQEFFKKWRTNWPPKRPLIPVAVCFLLLLSFFDHFFPSLLFPSLKNESSRIVHQHHQLEGRIRDSVEVTPSGARVVLDSLFILPERVPLPGKLLLHTSLVPEWERGDRIRFETKVKRPARYKNPGSFDYRHFLEREGILYTGFIERPENIVILEKKASLNLRIDHLRRSLSKILETPFLRALVINDRSGMSEDLWEIFRRTGTTHLIAISGQHIGAIILVFYVLVLWIFKRSETLLLKFRVKRLAGLVAFFPALAYTLIAGSPPSALRALVISLLICLAAFADREIDTLTALAIAAMGISLTDLSAPFTASFQLSFLAVLGILVFKRKPSPLAGEGWGEGAFWKYLITPFLMSLGATLFTAPLVAYQFHQVSLSGILTNLWAIPVVGFLLIYSGFSLTVFALIPSLGNFLLSSDRHLADVFLKALSFSSHYSWVIAFYPTEFETFLLFLSVGLLARLYRQPRNWRWALGGGGFVLLMWVLSFSSLGNGIHKGSLEVSFLDVGQGDSALVISPTGKSLLVDAGGFLIPGKNRSSFDIGEEVVVPYLKRRGFSKIDRILLSHPHPDHYGGLKAVIENFPVGEFWMNGQDFPDESYEDLQTLLAEHLVPKKILRKGDRFFWEGLEVEVLYPDRIRAGRNINDNSLVLRLRFGEARVLFTGDIEGEGELALSDKPGLEATLLKIPHHGSRTSSSVPFIDTVHPRFAVVSLGEDNNFGFPHPGILEKYERRGVKVYRTDRNGLVTFIFPENFPNRDISIRTTSWEK